MFGNGGLLLRDFKPKSMLRRPEHIPERAKFPVVDAHNHLFGDPSAEELLAVMDQVGVRTFVNVTGNATTPCCYADYNKVGGISIQDIFDFLNDWFAASPYANTGGDGTTIIWAGCSSKSRASWLKESPLVKEPSAKMTASAPVASTAASAPTGLPTTGRSVGATGRL